MVLCRSITVTGVMLYVAAQARGLRIAGLGGGTGLLSGTTLLAWMGYSWCLGHIWVKACGAKGWRGKVEELGN